MKYTINMSPCEVLEQLMDDAELDIYSRDLVRRTFNVDSYDIDDFYDDIGELIDKIDDKKSYKASKKVYKKLRAIWDKLQ